MNIYHKNIITKTKYSSPLIDSSIKRLIKRCDRLYFRARKSSSPDIKSHYKRFRAHVQKVIRDAYWKHISNIFSFDTESADPDCPRKNEKAKKFWSFVKSLKKDAFGINSLIENGFFFFFFFQLPKGTHLFSSFIDIQRVEEDHPSGYLTNYMGVYCAI